MPNEATCPARLFDVCLKLVSENLDLVESFQGFPSLVGEKIFQRALKTQRIRDLGYAGQAVQLFAEAFGSELLTTLNVAGQHLGLNYYLDQIFIFTDLVHLDVSDCGLGDNHELLTHISKLRSLESLHLRNSHISDVGMRKLTLAYRMFGNGPHELSTLDLSGNIALTEGCLKYVSPFPKLQCVILFHCSNIKVGAHRDWSVQEDDSLRVPLVHTSGWASSLVTMWMDDARSKARKQPRQRKSFFYSKPTTVSTSQFSSTDLKFGTKSCLVAYRYRDKPDLNDTETKETSLKHSVEEDNNLMNQYLTDSQTVDPANNLLSGLTKSDSRKPHCIVSSKTSQCQKISKSCSFIKYKVHASEDSKWSQSACRFSGKGDMKESLDMFSTPKSQPTLLEYYNSGEKRKSAKTKKPALFPKLLEKQTQCTENNDKNMKGKAVLSVNEKLVKETNLIIKKRSIPKEDNASAAETNVLDDRPKKKRRKIVIIKPRTDISETGKPSKDEGTKSGAKTCDRKTRTPLLDSLNKWI